MLLRNHSSMKNNTHSLLIQYGIASGFLLLANMSQAVTTLVSTSRYSVTEGVAFAYTFQRTSSSHPFVIMDNSAAAFMSGTDGAFSRTTSSSAGISNATLTPIANFTADPAPTSDLISWTPSQSGDFWYTCSVTGHPDMAGKITVVPEPSAIALIAGGLAFASLRRRRN